MLVICGCGEGAQFFWDEKRQQNFAVVVKNWGGGLGGKHFLG